MPFTRQETNKRRLRASAERLIKFLDLGAPDSVVATEVCLLLRTALCLNTNETGKAVGNILGTAMRAFFGVCIQCGSDHDRGAELECPACQLRDEMEFGDIPESTEQPPEESP